MAHQQCIARGRIHSVTSTQPICALITQQLSLAGTCRCVMLKQAWVINMIGFNSDGYIFATLLYHLAILEPFKDSIKKYQQALPQYIQTNHLIPLHRSESKPSLSCCLNSLQLAQPRSVGCPSSVFWLGCPGHLWSLSPGAGRIWSHGAGGWHLALALHYLAQPDREVWMLQLVCGLLKTHSLTSSSPAALASSESRPFTLLNT